MPLLSQGHGQTTHIFPMGDRIVNTQSISLNESHRTLKALGTQFVDLARELEAALDRHYVAHGAHEREWVRAMFESYCALGMALDLGHPDREACTVPLEPEESAILAMIAEADDERQMGLYEAAHIMGGHPVYFRDQG